jgi:hypothetical protein
MMNKNKRYRIELVKRYGHLYMKHPVINYESCFYCGLICEIEIDHVPPLRWVAALGASWFTDRDTSLWLIPSCRECNSKLLDLPVFTVKARKKHIFEVLEKKYTKKASAPKWTDSELSQLGETLKQKIESGEEIRSLLFRRIKWAAQDDELPGLEGAAVIPNMFRDAA